MYLPRYLPFSLFTGPGTPSGKKFTGTGIGNLKISFIQVPHGYTCLRTGVLWISDPHTYTPIQDQISLLDYL